MLSSICVAGDDRPPLRLQQFNDALLQYGDLLWTDLHAQVSPRHHHAVRSSTISSSCSIACGFSILAMTGLRRPASQEDPFNARTSAALRTKAERDDINILREAEIEVQPVLVGQGREAELQAGQVHALALLRSPPSTTRSTPHSIQF